MKTVYGLMTNTGNGDEFLYDLGVWEDEEAAADYLKSEMPHSTGIWVNALTVNDAFPSDLDISEDEMTTCSLCGIEYNEADIKTIDDKEICIYCEPAYKENIPG